MDVRGLDVEMAEFRRSIEQMHVVELHWMYMVRERRIAPLHRPTLVHLLVAARRAATSAAQHQSNGPSASSARVHGTLRSSTHCGMR